MTRDERIKKYTNLVYYIAHKYHHSSGKLDFEDLAQHGMIGLIKAAESYDDSYGHDFKAYAYATILGYMKGAHYAAGLAKRRQYTDSTGKRKYVRVFHNEVEMTESHCSAASDNNTAVEQLESRVLSNQLKDAIKRLRPQYRHVIRMRLQGLTFTAIGENLNLSRERIRQIEALATEELKNLMRVQDAA